jgi:choline dehydrogenase
MTLFDRSYDYVIVGGGTAGCVLANRLSADPSISVLMLEAGHNGRDIRIEVPLFLSYLIGNPRFDWLWKSEPEPHLDGRVLPLPRGRMLGGSSCMNGMVYVRGHRYDYDRWAELGNDGWSWDEVLPYFMRSERAIGETLQGHGRDGEWINSDPGMRWPVLDAYLDAAEQAGIPKTDDYNSGDNDGVAYFRASVHKGRRQTAEKAFLRPARGRPNLTVATGALASRLVVEGKRVAGVEVMHEGRRAVARAGREVILSAGAFASPALLERSGIGQAERLKAMGIAPVLDLPGVGENLQDHWQIRVQHRMHDTPTLNARANSMIGRALMGIEYFGFRKGPLAAQPTLLAAFTSVMEDAPAPDVQIHVSAASYDRVGGPLHDFPGITSSVCILRPESRGHVHIASADPAAQPAILNNFLATEADREIAIRSVELVRRIAAQPAFAAFRPQETAPGADAQGRKELLAFARKVVATIFHPVGTCRMGRDPMAVVTPDLKLRGLDGLRVADASIMPTIPSGNTAAPVVMVAEKAADLIRADRPAQSA